MYAYSTNSKLFNILIESPECKEIHQIKNACCIVTKNNDFEDESDDDDKMVSTNIWGTSVYKKK